MPNDIISLDIGASQLTIALFEQLKPMGLKLLKYAIAPLGVDPGDELDTSAYIVSAVREMMREQDIKPGPVLLSVSGKDVFPRFIKLPPAAHDKVDQIVQYEAQQNVPFPINEVVWDYQLIDSSDGSQSVMLVAMKTDVVKKITDCVEAAGLDPEVVDVAPLALYNLVRFNYGELDTCTLVMDMGARTTNLIFIEKERCFTRSIPIAGNTITQELMKEFEIPFKDAEELKLAHAFVAFGGAVDGADSHVVNRVSKTVRSVMTRLHAEVSRSINFYRSQQNGRKPSLLLLCGGTCVIPQTDTFLREKLGLDVEFLNPFERITVSNSIPSEDVATKIHLLGEVTGVALRKLFSCPMEINLMPQHLVARKLFKSKIPFLIAVAVGLVLTVSVWWYYFLRLRVTSERNLAKIEQGSVAFDMVQGQLDQHMSEALVVQKKAERLLYLVSARTQWMEILDDLKSRTVEGMWISSVNPVLETREGKHFVGQLRITGVGFVDKVPDAATVGEFGNALKTSSFFTDDVDVERIVTANEYSLGFTIRAALKNPMEL